jgi:hypothetical protein
MTRKAVQQLRKKEHVKQRLMGSNSVAASARATDKWADSSLVIRYTTDGTEPTTASPAYVPGHAPTLASLLPSGASSVTIKAMGWIDGNPTGLVITTTWEAR